MKDCPCQTRYFLRRVCRATTVVILATIIAIFLSTLTAIEAYFGYSVVAAVISDGNVETLGTWHQSCSCSIKWDLFQLIACESRNEW